MWFSPSFGLKFGGKEDRQVERGFYMGYEWLYYPTIYILIVSLITFVPVYFSDVVGTDISSDYFYDYTWFRIFQVIKLYYLWKLRDKEAFTISGVGGAIFLIIILFFLLAGILLNLADTVHKIRQKIHPEEELPDEPPEEKALKRKKYLLALIKEIPINLFLFLVLVALIAWKEKEQFGNFWLRLFEP